MSILSFFQRIYKDYRYETLFTGGALFLCILSLTAYFLSFRPVHNDKPPILSSTIQNASVGHEIAIDISGAVNKPDMYIFSGKPRLKDALERAGGLSSEADNDFVARNFNLSRFLSDQEKIYVPSRQEVFSNIFVEEPRTLQYLSPVEGASGNLSPSKVSINKASQQELETLDGIGPSLAQQIISHRPYSSLDDLTKKQVLKKTQFTKIANSISL